MFTMSKIFKTVYSLIANVYLLTCTTFFVNSADDKFKIFFFTYFCPENRF